MDTVICFTRFRYVHTFTSALRSLTYLHVVQSVMSSSSRVRFQIFKSPNMNPFLVCILNWVRKFGVNATFVNFGGTTFPSSLVPSCWNKFDHDTMVWHVLSYQFSLPTHSESSSYQKKTRDTSDSIGWVERFPFLVTCQDPSSVPTKSRSNWWILCEIHFCSGRSYWNCIPGRISTTYYQSPFPRPDRKKRTLANLETSWGPIQ